MAAIVRTWSLVTAVLVRRLTSAATAPYRTATLTILVVTVVLVTALGCAVVLTASSVQTAPSTCVS